MNKQKFHGLLSDRITALSSLQLDAESGCDTVSLDQSCVGRLSRMDAMQAQAMNQAAQRRREAERLRLKAALLRLENDEYGYCESCDELISEGRLMIDLSARFCIECASAREQA